MNKVFGPTYPGEVLNFPGVWFAFDEEASAPPLPSRTTSPPLSVGGGGQGQGVDRNAEVKRVVICQRGKDSTDPSGLGEVGECPSMEGELKSVSVYVSSLNII